jgi:hypothetical protein
MAFFVVFKQAFDGLFLHGRLRDTPGFFAGFSVVLGNDSVFTFL